MAMIAASVWMATSIFARSMRGKSLLFSWLQVFTAAGFAFSHGANDIANAIGAIAAILDVLRSGSIHAAASVPPDASSSCCCRISSSVSAATTGGSRDSTRQLC